MAIIRVQLGYQDDLDDPVLTAARQLRVNQVLVALDQLDEAIRLATLDSMAVQVDELKVDYQSHIVMLKHEGSRLLRELARLSNLSVEYDRFANKRSINFIPTYL